MRIDLVVERLELVSFCFVVSSLSEKEPRSECERISAERRRCEERKRSTQLLNPDKLFSRFLARLMHCNADGCCEFELDVVVVKVFVWMCGLLGCCFNRCALPEMWVMWSHMMGDPEGAGKEWSSMARL